VVAALPNHDVAHLACHALAEVARPLESGLLLAGDEALTLGEIFQLRLWRMRLCFLSACDTGVVGRHVPDEVVSFPMGLIQAGAGGVIASMWPVRDTTAAVLAAAFYRRWPTAEPDPARALRDAQRWLRHSTTAQADDLLVGLLPDEQRSALVAANGTRPGDRAFPLVVDWSAFTYVGG
jgi:CHAT domain-containing protein